jgi:hypothetical protein
LLVNLGHTPPEIDQWWPLLLILIGLATIVREPRFASAKRTTADSERSRRGPTGGLVLIGLGLALLLSHSLGRESSAALVLTATGLALLVSRLW